jgi:hypothetical protein
MRAALAFSDETVLFLWEIIGDVGCDEENAGRGILSVLEIIQFVHHVIACEQPRSSSNQSGAKLGRGIA